MLIPNERLSQRFSYIDEWKSDRSIDKSWMHKQHQLGILSTNFDHWMQMTADADGNNMSIGYIMHWPFKSPVCNNPGLK